MVQMIWKKTSRKCKKNCAKFLPTDMRGRLYEKYEFVKMEDEMELI